MKLYSVYDRKVGAFGNPVPAKTDAELVRMLTDAIAYGDTILSKHPEDFDVYFIGELDLNSGVITVPENNKPTFVTSVVPVAESCKGFEVGDDA